MNDLLLSILYTLFGLFPFIFGLKTLLKPVIKKLYMTSATGEVVDVVPLAHVPGGIRVKVQYKSKLGQIADFKQLTTGNYAIGDNVRLIYNSRNTSDPLLIEPVGFGDVAVPAMAVIVGALFVSTGAQNILRVLQNTTAR